MADDKGKGGGGGHINLLIRQGELRARLEETPRGPLYYIASQDLETWMQQRRPAGRPKGSKEGTP